MKIYTKLIAIILSMVFMLQTVYFVFPYVSAISLPDEDNVEKITVTNKNGEKVNNITLGLEKSEVISVNAQGDANYQWQILLDEENNCWANILDKTDKDLYISEALFNNASLDNGSAKLRCIVSSGSDEAASNDISVNIQDEFDDNDDDDDDNTGEEQPDINTVTIKINYIYADDPSNQIQNSYVATIEKGSIFKETIISPVSLGFKPYYCPENPSTENPEDATALAESLSLNYESTDSDVTYNLYYKPAEVDYKLTYNFQNINDDCYVENVSLRYSGKATTGSYIDDDTILSHLKPENIKGFSYLYHYPIMVASDGSTVINSYFDRKYYLLTLDADGGYGVEPVYAKYGSSFVAKEPTRAGYEFVGWDLISYNQENPDGTTATVIAEDGKADELPEIITQKATYKALWKKVNTGFNVVYWKENADDDSYTYWGTDNTQRVLSGTAVDGSDYKILPDSIRNTTPDWQQFEFSHADSHVIINSDSSSVINVYYKRKLHTYTFLNIPVDITADTSSLHKHTNSCKKITCDIQEHTHTEDCGIEEADLTNHTHSAECCVKPLHTHSYNCYGIKWLDSYPNDTSVANACETQLNYFNSTQHLTNGTLLCYRYGQKKFFFFIRVNNQWLFVRFFNGSTIENLNVNGITNPIETPAEPGKFLSAKLAVNTTICTTTPHSHSDGSCKYMCQYVRFCNCETHIHDELCCSIPEHVHTNTCFGIKTLDAYDADATIAEQCERAKSSSSSYLNSINAPDGTIDVYRYGEKKFFFFIYINHESKFVKYYNASNELKNVDLNGFTYNKETPLVGFHSYALASLSNCSKAVHFHGNGECNANKCNKRQHAHTTECYYNCEQQQHSHGDSCYSITCGKLALSYIKETVYGTSYYKYVVTAKYGQDIHKIWQQAPLTTLTNGGYMIENNINKGRYDLFTHYMGDSDVLYSAFKTENSQYTYNAYYYLEIPSTSDEAPAITGTGEQGGTKGKKYYKYHTTTFKYSSNSLRLTYDEDYFPINGYVQAVGKSLFESDDKYRKYTESSTDSKLMEINLFYDLNSYNVDLTNYDGTPVTTDINGNELSNSKSYKYQDLIEDYNSLTPSYPKTLQKDAYEFKGWYTTKQFFESTRFSSGMIMPSNNVVLYAKWEPVHYKVNFFTTEDVMNKYIFTQNQELAYKSVNVLHNGIAGNVTDPIHPNTTEDFKMSFMGWFYYSDGAKKVFTPADTHITSDMNVFAEWSSNKVQPYRIECVLADDHSVQIADPVLGLGFAGTSRTFYAKNGKPATELYPQYQNGGYYPTISSHSMVIQYEGEDVTPENAKINVYTFEYVQIDSTKYTVRYIDKTTGEKLCDDTVVEDVTDAVVSVRYKSFSGYMPDMTYKRCVLSADSSYNVVTFYYTKNTTTAYYTVHYLLQERGKTQSEDVHYKESESDYLAAIGEIDKNVEITPVDFDGYSISPNAKCKTGESEETTDIIQNTDNSKFTIKVHRSGTDLYLYYNLNRYPYEIRYLDYDTKEPLAKAYCSTAQYGALVTGNAIEIPNCYCVSESTSSSITINKENTDNAENNVITFYYLSSHYIVNYRLIGPEEGGSLTSSSRVTKIEEPISGSTVNLNFGYEFIGWYTDRDCKIPANSSQQSDDDLTFVPDKEDLIKDNYTANTFYAKIKPMLKYKVTYEIPTNATGTKRFVAKDFVTQEFIDKYFNGEAFDKLNEDIVRDFIPYEAVNSIDIIWDLINIEYYYEEYTNTMCARVLPVTSQTVVTAKIDTNGDGITDSTITADKGQQFLTENGETLSANGEGEFSCWEIRPMRNSDDESCIIKCYSQTFNYCGYDDYIVKAIYNQGKNTDLAYSDKPESETRLLGIARSHWNDTLSGENEEGSYGESGKDYDRVYVDFTASYSFRGKQINQVTDNSITLGFEFYVNGIMTQNVKLKNEYLDDNNCLEYFYGFKNSSTNRNYTYTIKPYMLVGGNKAYGNDFSFNIKGNEFKETYVK